MINLQNITPEMKEKCTVKADRYLDTLAFDAVELLRSVMNELPSEAVLIGANIINAYRRGDESEHIDMTPQSYIVYTLNNFIIYLEFGHFWAFEGVMMTAYPIVNGTYQKTRYPIDINVGTPGGILELIALAKDPNRVYEKMVPIKIKRYRNAFRDTENVRYTSQVHEATGTFYIG